MSAQDAIDLTLDLSPGLMARAMMRAGQELQTGAPISLHIKRGAMLAGLALLLAVAQVALHRLYEIELFNAGLVAGMIFAFASLILMQRGAINLMAERVVQAAARRGPVRLTVGPGGLSERSGIGRIDVVWDAVESISAVANGTVVRFGGMCFAIPDTALPDGLTPEDLRMRLESWRSADESFG
ncbi:MAG: hypothetical protein AAF557_10895 [Pseudomonadota bacterium]